MKISDTTNGNGVIQKCELFTELGNEKISGNPIMLKQFLGLINDALSHVWHIIFISSKDSKFDDATRYTLPIWEEDVSIGINKIALLSEILVIDKIEYKIDDGKWYKLRLINEDEINSNDINSIPTGYHLYEGVIFLNAKATNNNKIKYHYKRNFLEVTLDDLNMSLGFASPYHIIIPKIVSLEWLKMFRPNSKKINVLTDDIKTLEDNIKTLYSFKVGDAPPQKLRVKQNNFK